MIRRDFVKRLSALAALPILPAFLRREPKPAALTYSYGNFYLVPPRDTQWVEYQDMRSPLLWIEANGNTSPFPPRYPDA